MKYVDLFQLTYTIVEIMKELTVEAAPVVFFDVSYIFWSHGWSFDVMLGDR